MAPPRSRVAVIAACALIALGAAACGNSGDDASDHESPPGAQPEGDYRYATEGFERIGGPLPGRLRYPATTTVAVEHSGCVVSELWEARPERHTEWRYCVGARTWILRSVTDYHEFFGNVERRVYRCTGRAVPRPVRLEAGFRWTDRCRAARTRAVARARVAGVTMVTVGSERVPAVHVRVRTRLSGDVRGAYTMDSWLRRADGLLLKRSFTSDSTVESVVGRVPAHEEYTLRLRSTQPQA